MATSKRDCCLHFELQHNLTFKLAPIVILWMSVIYFSFLKSNNNKNVVNVNVTLFFCVGMWCFTEFTEQIRSTCYTQEATAVDLFLNKAPVSSVC